IDDGTGTSAPGTVSLIVNTPPTGAADNYSVPEDGLLAVGAGGGVVSNDSDPDGNAITAELVQEPANGTFGFLGDGSFTYSPDQDYAGTDSFTYRLHDEFDSSEIVTVQIEVTPVNDSPQPQVDSYFTLPGETLNVSASDGVLANDVDVDGPEMNAALVTTASNGTLDLGTDGSFSYTPNGGFEGDDTFTYQFTDGILSSSPTTVTLSVSSQPVLISEIHATNVNGLTTKVRDEPDARFPRESESPDWIEIYNRVGLPFDVGGMHLTDDPDDGTKWTFPAGTMIEPHGYLVVFASGKNITNTALDEAGLLHTNFGLSATGEYVAITDAAGIVVDELTTYPEQTADVSYGRVDDSFFYFPTPTPGAANGAGVTGFVEDTKFDIGHGYYDAPVNESITTETLGATLVYTTDASIPTLENGTKVQATSVDVAPVLNLTISQTTTLRVAAFKDGLLSTNVDTQTYLFVDDIVQQRDMWNVVTEDPRWQPQLKDSIKSLPAISIVTDGRITPSREVPASVELINPDGTIGFQIDAGVEHYGGHSINSPKKNMRVRFRTAYGDSTLKYDFFGGDAVDEFDQILLRTGSHDNWFWTHPAGGQGNYVRGRWAFDRQLEMGQLAPHGRWVQVYVNGKFEGLHHLMERPDASFMASYLGGEPEDYDALNAGTAIDGDTDAWRRLLSAEVIGDYEKLQQYLDVENYADYMLLQFYAGNDWDWNTSQNWAGARKREDGAGYIFFAWDSDVMLRTTLQANVIDRGGPGDLWKLRGGVKQHEELLLLMADRAHRYFFNEGMLTSERLRADVAELADRIRLPIIAETARWGRNGYNGVRYTPEVWEGALDWMLDRFAPETGTDRTAVVIRQLERSNIYPETDAPEYLLDGKRQHGGAASDAGAIDFVSPDGPVYYTMDGSDPRLPGGALNPDAILYDGTPFSLSTTTVLKSRALNGAEWSALSEAEFIVNTVPADATNLRITEVNYHPADPTDAEIALGHTNGDDFEFIEIQNISDLTIDLSNVSLQFSTVDGNEQGVEFNFSEGSQTRLAPGEFLVVVEDLSAFTARYGSEIVVAGQWQGGLGNRTEQLTLAAGGEVVHQFFYVDEWYSSTDGGGRTLEVASANQASELWGTKDGWRESPAIGGSPGSAAVEEFLAGDANRDGIFNSSDLVLVFQASEFEDGIDGNSTWEEGDWNGDGDFTTADLVAAFQLGHYSAALKPQTATLHDSAIKQLFAATESDSKRKMFVP
ncbi:MAG: tandem-95 repeat protein, partial [Planctomycetales bacterium]|nr:tandem-95 repeat protein [Planctomycetales bacterium]